MFSRFCVAKATRPSVVKVVRPSGRLTSRLGALIVATLVAAVSVGILASPASATAVSNTIDVGQYPQQPKLNSSGTELWVLNNGDNTISVINTSTGAITHTVTGLNNPYDLWFTTDGSKVYVNNASSDTVKVISTSTYAVVNTLNVGHIPQGLTIRGTSAYTANYSANSVTKMSTTGNGSVTNTFTFGGGALGLWGLVISPDGTTGYIATSVNTLLVFNTSNGALIRTVTLGSSGENLTINASGSIVYVAEGNANSVQAINTNTWAVTSVSVGEYPITVTLSPDGNTLYAANENGNTVSVIDTSNFTVSSTITVGANPFGMAISADSETGYVANWGENTVSVVSSLGAPSAPSQPVTPTVTFGNASASVSFDAPDNGGSAITGYQYSTDNGSTWSSLSTTGTTTLTATITGLTNGTTYQVKVRANNALGTSTGSRAASVTPATVPGAPTAVTATGADSEATLNFTAPASNGGSAILYYEYSTDGTSWNFLNSNGSPAVTGYISGLNNGTAYLFRVRAVTSIGHSSSAAAAGSVTPATTPDAPSGVIITPGDTTATVTFTAPADGGAAITSYEYSLDSGGTWSTLTTTGTSTLSGTITGLANGTGYPVEVRANNAAGSSTGSGPDYVTPVTVPDPPTSVTATAGDTQVTLDFTVPASDGGSAITGYEYTTDNGTTWTTFTTSPTGASTAGGDVTGLTNGTSYTFGVRAVTTAGHSSSAAASAVTPVGPATAPLAPSGFSVDPGDTTATVTFTAPDDGGSPITGYEYSSDNAQSWSALTVTGTTTLTGTITGLANGITYQVAVRADNSVGNGTGTTPTSVTPGLPPDAPTGVTATAGDAQVTLDFTVPASDGGSPITGYEYSTDGTTWTALTSSTTDSSVTGTVTGLTNGTSYTVSVRALTQSGHSVSASAAGSVTPLGTPEVPASVVVTRGDSSATVTFTAPADGGQPIDSYQYSLDNGSTWSALSTTGSSTLTGTITGLTNGTTYQVKVRAHNSVGSGTATTATSVTPATVPGAPTAVTATGGNGQVSLSFTVPASNGGSAITGYEYSTDGTTWTALSSSTSGSSVTGTVSGLTNGTSYTFGVRAVTAVGHSSAAAASGTVMPAGPPLAPSGLTVTAGPTIATVSFTPAGDGGSAITGYDYSTDNGSTWSALSTTGSSTLTGTITGLTNGTTYQVKIRAHNSAGNGTATTATSVTPGTVPDAPTAVTATGGDGQVGLSFTVPASNGGSAITGYEYSTDGTTWTALSSSTSGSSVTGTVTGLTNGTSYTFSVRALTAVGHSRAAAASGTVMPAGAPVAPSGLTVTSGNTSATVSFTPAGDGGSAITGYDYSLDNGSTWSALSTTGSSTLTGTITGLTNGTTYQVKVRAHNSVGNGTATTATSVTPATVPGAPTAVTATGGNGQVSLSFTVPASNGGSAITGYEYSTDGTTWTALSSSTSGSSVTGTVSGLTNGTSYTFGVRAVTAVGHSSAAAASGTVMPAGPPVAPSGLTVTSGNTSATVTFTPAGDGGSAITGYDYSTDNGSTWSALSTTGTTTLMGTITGLTNGTTYQVKIRAHNSAGNGTATTATSVTPATVPGAPSAVVATVGNAFADVAFSAPSATGGSAITGYTVTSTPGGLTATCSTSPCTVTGLSNGTSYTFTVYATNSAGASTESAASAAVTPQTVPQAPGALVISTTATTATVTFTVAPDGGAPITGYQVSLNGGSSWIAFTATISGASGSGVLTGLLPGSAYSILLRAVNANGPSAASSSAAFTTVPATLSAPSALAGTASVTVSWPQSSQSDVTGYTVSAQPGLATCSTYSISATSCVLGAVAGTSYSYTVVAHSAAGDSAPSEASAAVSATPPTVPTEPPLSAPTTLTTTDGTLTSVVPLQPITVVGTGFAPYSTAKIIVYSTPILLATATTDGSGNFSVPVTVPTGLAVGEHNLVASGVDPSGAVHMMRMPVTISSTTPPAVHAPTRISITTAGTTATIHLLRPSTSGGAEITGYQVSLNAGNTWSALATTGAGTLTGKLTRLTVGKIYHVKVRAMAGTVAGTASASIIVAIAKAWFRDPISPAGRRSEAQVPANPAGYRGGLQATTSTYRSYNGTIAVPVSWTRGRQLAAHQAATLTGDGLFAFDSAAITAAGTTTLKALALSVKGSKSLTCEGYADYGNKIAHQTALSTLRARSVCAALKSFGVKASMTAIGYGAARPVIIGGTPANRAPNRRVVIYVNR